MRNLFVVIALLSLVACGGRQVESRLPPEPEASFALLDSVDGLFVYRTSEARRQNTSKRHFVSLEEFSLELNTSEEWNSSVVGNAVWMSHESGSRFVIYPPEKRLTHAERLRHWHEIDSQAEDSVAGNILHIASGRQPYIYVVNQHSQGRIRLGYALLADEDDSASGVVVTGTWPARLHDQLAPQVIDAANTLQLSRR